MHQIPHALSGLLYSSDAKVCEPIDHEIPVFECSPDASEQRLKKKLVPGARFLGYSSKNINVVTRSHTASHTSANDNLDTEFDANDWRIRNDEPQVLDYLALSLSALKSVKGQNYNHFYQLMLATNARVFCSNM